MNTHTLSHQNMDHLCSAFDHIGLYDMQLSDVLNADIIQMTFKYKSGAPFSMKCMLISSFINKDMTNRVEFQETFKDESFLYRFMSSRFQQLIAYEYAIDLCDIMPLIDEYMENVYGHLLNTRR